MVRGYQGKTLQVTTRNATFQQWQALLGNRTARHRQRRFLVQGVRPITIAAQMASQGGWRIDSLLLGPGRLSEWATQLLDDNPRATRYELSAALMGELGERDEQQPELLAVVVMPPDDLARLRPTPRMLALAVDRPANPGNLGTLIRSADAMGAQAVIVTGHATDLYDPRCVRATTGSLFAVPAACASGAAQVLEWVGKVRADGVPLQVLVLAEDGARELSECDLTGPTLLVVGNEARGVSAAWLEGGDQRVRIPMTGSASSLNAAVSGSLALYEAMGQRRNRGV